MSGLLPTLTASLAEAEPRRAALNALQHLMSHAGAQSAALCSTSGDLLAGHALSQADLDRIRSWVAAGARPGLDHTHWVAVLGDGALCVYLGHPAAPAVCARGLQDLAPLLEAAGHRLRHGPTDGFHPAIREFLSEAPEDVVERLRLAAQLERHEWNVAAVARSRGISRLTVYRAMQRLGIAREKRQRR